MISRKEQNRTIQDTLTANKSAFVAFTGRRRVGKTYLIDQAYGNNMCLQFTGIQNANTKTQIINFVQKIVEQSGTNLFVIPKNWQEVFIILKNHLKTLPKNKKQVIVIDELPWVCTPKSGFLQLLAHLWNDYLSKEKHFILVICGSATSWITQKVLNDKGGLHNRVTQTIHLQPFTLAECKLFFESKKINLTNKAITDLYMTMGGNPFYLENVKKGESSNAAIERMCFTETGILKNEYQNLYQALFENPNNHEAIVQTLALSQKGMSQADLLAKSKVTKGGPFNRAMTDLLLSGFVVEAQPYGKLKRGLVYRLVDEFSIFHHRFIKPNKKSSATIWQTIAASQSYKIWKGFAFESLCLKHIPEIKTALGIKNVYTQVSSFSQKGTAQQDGFQIDVVIDRKDDTINLCECKYYEAPFELDKKQAQILAIKRVQFRDTTKTRKTIFNTLITNQPIKQNEYSLDCVDVHVTIDDIM
jgi:uncharacterized protein